MTATPAASLRRADPERCLALEAVLARAFGGLLPEHRDEAAVAATFGRVLDVGCGFGGWALEMARQYPALEVYGFDVDAARIDGATRLARARGLGQTSFRVMDARAPLDYPDAYFDLVNVRCVQLERSGWPGLLAELFRLTRPGGVVRLTDAEDAGVTTSPAYERLSALFLQACRARAISFSPTGRSLGLAPAFVALARQAGYADVRAHASALHWSFGTEAHAAVAEDMIEAFARAVPFIAGAGLATAGELRRLQQSVEADVASEGFCALWTFCTISGRRPAATPRGTA